MFFACQTYAVYGIYTQMYSILFCHITTATLFSIDHSVENHKGSISAEHGLGINKNHLIAQYSKSEKFISFMSDIKKLFDPKVGGISMFISYHSIAGNSKSLQNSSVMSYLVMFLS